MSKALSEEAKPRTRHGRIVHAATACLAALALLLAGCASPAREEGPLVGNLAPGFTVRPVDGQPFTLAAHRAVAAARS